MLFKSLAISGMVVVAGSLPALPQGLATVQPGQEIKIDAWQTCRLVRNTGNAPFMVPIASADEWSSGGHAFLNNIAGMDAKVSICPPPPPPPSSGGCDRSEGRGNGCGDGGSGGDD
ncbi:hypothetical protein [Paracoccus sp. ME4]|uniref:hypothetical protein n=1 Tax=Paracoccus sp. ME4 TaxID=3138066 RepID=UPI00398BB451